MEMKKMTLKVAVVGFIIIVLACLLFSCSGNEKVKGEVTVVAPNFQYAVIEANDGRQWVAEIHYDRDFRVGQTVTMTVNDNGTGHTGDDICTNITIK